MPNCFVCVCVFIIIINNINHDNINRGFFGMKLFLFNHEISFYVIYVTKRYICKEKNAQEGVYMKV